jgi:hypothetical protein
MLEHAAPGRTRSSPLFHQGHAAIADGAQPQLHTKTMPKNNRRNMLSMSNMVTLLMTIKQ